MVNRASAAQILTDAHGARTDGARPSSPTCTGARRTSRSRVASSSHSRGGSPDITAIVGEHVHIVQPIRILNGKPVVFGEGNLISNQTSACCPAASQDG